MLMRGEEKQEPGFLPFISFKGLVVELLEIQSDYKDKRIILII